MPPVTLNLIIANVAVFLLENAGMVSPGGLSRYGLRPPGRRGPTSSPGSSSPTASCTATSRTSSSTCSRCTCSARDVERLFGSRFFAAYYFASVLAAAICHLIVTTWMGAEPVPTVGASGGIYGVLLAYGIYFPHRQVMLLIPPIPMSARMFVVGVRGAGARPRRHRHRGRRRALRAPRRDARGLSDDPLPPRLHGFS